MNLPLIRKLGDPALRRKAEPVVEYDQKLHDLLDKLTAVMKENNGLGLAATQIGVGKAVAVVRLGEDFPVIELVNPEIAECNGCEGGLEGCLSVPGVYGEVERHGQITVNFFDRHGKEQQITATGLLARALQHEIDHLNGVVFIDKVIRYVDEGQEVE